MYQLEFTMKIHVNKPQTKSQDCINVNEGLTPKTNEKAFIQFLQGNREDHPIINLLHHKSQQVNK